MLELDIYAREAQETSEADESNAEKIIKQLLFCVYYDSKCKSGKKSAVDLVVVSSKLHHKKYS